MSEIKCIDCGKSFTIGPYHVPLTRCLDCLVKLEERYPGVIREDAALRAENERLRALARFGALLLPKWWDDGCPYDIDGGDAQAAAEKAGLWRQVEKHADGVECEWCGGEGPCGELTEAGLAALAASEPAPAMPEEVREAAEMLRLTVGMREAKHACDDRACSNVALGALNLLAALAARGGRS